MGNQIQHLVNFMKENNEKLDFVFFRVDDNGDIVSCTIETQAESQFEGYKCHKSYQKDLTEFEYALPFVNTLSKDKPTDIKYSLINN